LVTYNPKKETESLIREEEDITMKLLWDKKTGLENKIYLAKKNMGNKSEISRKKDPD
jgi:hypothetical protein